MFKRREKKKEKHVKVKVISEEVEGGSSCPGLGGCRSGGRSGGVRGQANGTGGLGRSGGGVADVRSWGGNLGAHDGSRGARRYVLDDVLTRKGRVSGCRCRIV